MSRTINVMIWNENIEEQQKPEVLEHYPGGIHGELECILMEANCFRVRTATLDDPQFGLEQDMLEKVDVLVWWSHNAFELLPDEVAQRVVDRVRDGMGLVALHSAMLSKVFKGLMRSSCTADWRNIGEKEVIWSVNPKHPVSRGIEFPFELEHEEMYSEPFDVPTPDELVFVSWFEGGEIFRSGLCYSIGKGRVFYFRPGHETYPTFLHPSVRRVIQNATIWAACSR
ncbi:MAG: ThuA domain-containing protein [Pseudomonadota bacterium]